MSDSRQQSYYEIALTNRQVVMVFVVLLVCVLAAFLGGVWVGRDSTPLVATVEPEAISSGVSPGAEPLRELGFFSREEAESVGPADPSSVTMSGEGEAEASEPSQPVIIEQLRQEPAPKPERQVDRATNTDEAPSAPQRSAGPVSVISATEVDATQAPPGELVVQVFSSTDQSQAQRVLERVQSGGYAAALSPIDSDGRRMYRVRVGPFTDRAEAQTVADRIRRTYKLDTWITR